MTAPRRKEPRRCALARPAAVASLLVDRRSAPSSLRAGLAHAFITGCAVGKPHRRSGTHTAVHHDPTFTRTARNASSRASHSSLPSTALSSWDGTSSRCQDAGRRALLAQAARQVGGRAGRGEQRRRRVEHDAEAELREPPDAEVGRLAVLGDVDQERRADAGAGDRLEVGLVARRVHEDQVGAERGVPPRALDGVAAAGDRERVGAGDDDRLGVAARVERRPAA